MLRYRDGVSSGWLPHPPTPRHSGIDIEPQMHPAFGVRFCGGGARTMLNPFCFVWRLPCRFSRLARPSTMSENQKPAALWLKFLRGVFVRFLLIRTPQDWFEAEQRNEFADDTLPPGIKAREFLQMVSPISPAANPCCNCTIK